MTVNQIDLWPFLSGGAHWPFLHGMKALSLRRVCRSLNKRAPSEQGKSFCLELLGHPLPIFLETNHISRSNITMVNHTLCFSMKNNSKFWITKPGIIFPWLKGMILGFGPWCIVVFTIYKGWSLKFFVDKGKYNVLPKLWGVEKGAF